MHGITQGNTITHMYDGNVGGVYLTLLIKTDVYCEAGDSGGLLYTKSGSTAKVVGICAGKNAGAFEYSLFSNASIFPWDYSVIN